MIEKLQLWPQILMLATMLLASLREILLHGQPAKEKYDATRATFGLIIAFFILAEGGFWKPLGW